MGEYIPGHNQTKDHSLEELRQGFYLDPLETVEMDVTHDNSHARRSYDVGNGITVEGRMVAEIRVGGETSYATGLVINTYQGYGKRRDVLVMSSPDSTQTFSAALTQDQMWGIGRGFEGQSMLPDTVSGDHCAVGINEAGRLIIENHNPTNLTGIRKIG